MFECIYIFVFNFNRQINVTTFYFGSFIILTPQVYFCFDADTLVAVSTSDVGEDFPFKRTIYRIYIHTSTYLHTVKQTLYS